MSGDGNQIGLDSRCCKKRLFIIHNWCPCLKILKEYFSFTIKQTHVIALLSELFQDYDYPEIVVIRSDSGSQFIAKKVREYLKCYSCRTGVYPCWLARRKCTHRSMSRYFKIKVFTRYDYRSFGQIQQILKRFVNFTILKDFMDYSVELLRWRNGKQISALF